MLLKIKKVSGFEDLPNPQYMTEGSVGMDLHAALVSSVQIMPGQYKLVSTGICMQIPKGYEGQVRPRSGLAAKYGVSLLNTPGTIDWDYRGELRVIMINFGKELFNVNRGDRIAQIIFSKVETPIIKIVEEIEETDRGIDGFGSTGL